MEAIELVSGYVPGAIGRITELHGSYYAQYWGMGLYFEAKVATELAGFLSRFNPAHDGAWFARSHGQIVGGIIVDGQDAAGQGARLRWFILDPAYHGRGLGSRLMNEAISFCRQQGFRRVYLTTFSGLESARHLYDRFGFKVCAEMDGSHLTGRAELVEQVMELLFTPEAG